MPGAHEAEAALALAQLAEARTHVALDPPVVQHVPVASGAAPGALFAEARHTDLRLRRTGAAPSAGEVTAVLDS